MRQSMTDLEYSNTDTSEEQVKEAICAVKVIMLRSLPLTHVLPEVALVGYKEKSTGRYKLLREICVFQTKELFASLTPVDGHVRLFALPYVSETDLSELKSKELPAYRVFESLTDSDIEQSLNSSATGDNGR